MVFLILFLVQHLLNLEMWKSVTFKWSVKDLLTLNLSQISKRRFLVRKRPVLSPFIVTHYYTWMQSHTRTHTLRPMSSLWSFCPDMMPRTLSGDSSKWRVQHFQDLNSWQIIWVWRANMHTLFIYNYLQISKAQTVLFPHGFARPSSSGPCSQSAGCKG